MAVPSDYAEARDPRTPGPRLAELATAHPELQPLIVLNPACPSDLHAEILRTNPSAQRVLEERATRPGGEWVQGGETGTFPGPESGIGGAGVTGSGATGPYSTGPSSTGSSSTGSYTPGQASQGPSSPGQYSTGPVSMGAGGSVRRLPPSEGSQVPETHRYSYQGASASTPDIARPDDPAYSAGPADPGYSAPSAQTGPLPEDLFEHAPAPAEHRGSRTAVWALAICLVVLVPLVVGGFFLARGMMGDRSDIGPETTAAAPATTSEAPSSTTAKPTSASPTTEDIASPAPKDAVDLGAVVSPSGNIACVLDGDSVRCSVTERGYAQEGREDCPADSPFTVSADQNGSALACDQTAAADGATTLDYGKSAKHGDVACTSEDSGMTCWNVKNRHGFKVNKSDYETF